MSHKLVQTVCLVAWSKTAQGANENGYSLGIFPQTFTPRREMKIMSAALVYRHYVYVKVLVQALAKKQITSVPSKRK